MKILLAHSNFPAQLRTIAQVLGANPDNEVYFLTKNIYGQIPGVKKIIYRPNKERSTDTHPYLYDLESVVRSGQRAYEACAKIKKAGFTPDIIFGCASWGTTLFLKDLYPGTPLGLSLEWFYRSIGGDVDFNPQYNLTPDEAARIRIKNSIILSELVASDAALCPTHFQKAQFPNHFKSFLNVIHEGVDTEFFKPVSNEDVCFETSGIKLSKNDEVISFATRGLEAYRGFPQFMEALSFLQKERANLHAVIAGVDYVFYGARLPEGRTFKQLCLEKYELDLTRVHFVDFLSLKDYRNLLQITKAHTYMTYPFVLSWSMLEAMACETPMVCSATPPVQEVITDNHNGILTDFFDTRELAAKITDLLEHPKKFIDIQKAGRKTIVENYELKACLRKRLTWLADLAQLKDLNP